MEQSLLFVRKEWQNLGKRPPIKALAQKEVFGNTWPHLSRGMGAGPALPGHLLTGKHPQSSRRGREIKGSLYGCLRAVGKVSLLPKSPPQLSSPSKSSDQRGHHCGTIPAAQGGSSTTHHGAALHSLHWPFPCNPQGDRSHSPISQAQKLRLMRGNALAKGSGSTDRGGASTQVCCQQCPRPASQGRREQVGSLGRVRARCWGQGKPQSL